MNCAEKLLDPTIFHQVTLEFSFGKSLAQEKFKSNLKFRYQIIVSSIKFGKGFACACVEISNIARCSIKVSKGAKIRNRYNQVPHLTQDTNEKVTNSQLDTTNESQEVSPFPAGNLQACSLLQYINVIANLFIT